jgi:hypothetical protein
MKVGTRMLIQVNTLLYNLCSFMANTKMCISLACDKCEDLPSLCSCDELRTPS